MFAHSSTILKRRLRKHLGVLLYCKSTPLRGHTVAGALLFCFQGAMSPRQLSVVCGLALKPEFEPLLRMLQEFADDIK
jgi:hypothetical protein